MLEEAKDFNHCLTELDQIAVSLLYLADASKEEDINHQDSYYLIAGLSKSLREVESQLTKLIYKK